MVIAKFIDGTEETYEIKGDKKEPWIFDDKEQCYKLDTITGIVVLPREFLKTLEHYEVE